MNKSVETDLYIKEKKRKLGAGIRLVYNRFFLYSVYGFAYTNSKREGSLNYLIGGVNKSREWRNLRRSTRNTARNKETHEKHRFPLTNIHVI